MEGGWRGKEERGEEGRGGQGRGGDGRGEKGMRWVSKGVKGLQQREKGLNDRICRCDSVKLVPCFLRVDEDVDDVTDVLRAATGRVEPRVTSVHVHRRTHASLLHTKHYLRSFTFHNTHDPTQSPKPTRPPFVKYRVGQKKPGPLCFMAYKFRNIKQIFTKFGTNQSLFILNIVPKFI